MLKQLMLNKKITTLRETLDSYLEEEKTFTSKRSELEQSIEEAETDEEVEAVEEEVESLENNEEELKEKKSKLEGEISELEKELEELKSKEPANNQRNEKGGNGMEIREAINNYVRTKGATRDGFTSVEGGALIPEELLKPEKALADVINLENLVRVRKVNSGGGKYPIIKKSGGRMVSVAELEQNPELAKPTIEAVMYDIETYRGYIPVSQEVIDDADYNVTGMIAEDIRDQELNTKNDAIADILKGATAMDAEGLDGLKQIFNVELKRVYNTKAIISASLYNELDTTKDNNGRYLLQDDITVSSGKRIFGHEIVVLDDEVIGENAGDLVGFIGDPYEFVTLFDRKKTSVKWVDNDVYGQLLAGFVRFDVAATDEDAGFYVTYTPGNLGE